MEVLNQLQNRYRYSLILLRQLVITDFKLRYQGSALGYLWSLLRPLALFAILYMVFANFFKIGDEIPNFPVYLLVGIVLWSYFAEVTSNSIGAIVGRGDLIRKLNFPRYVIVLSGSFSALINLFLNSIIIAIFIFFTGVDIRISILYIPLLIAELFVLSLAIAFFLSAAFVKFRDVNYIWEVIMQGAFYATPILYPLSLVPDSIGKILLLSPLAQIIQDVRHVLVTPSAETIGSLYGTGSARLITLAMVVVMAIVAAYYFRSRSKYFAEEV